jgi:predicted acylesterase/phospholipase RssA
MREGEPGGAVYVLLAGRLRVFVGQPDGTQNAVGEVGAGEVIGEMALLDHQPHSATVKAIRDSQLLEIARDDFERVSHQEPGVALAVARLVVERLGRSIHQQREANRIRCVALVAATDGNRLNEFAGRLAGALGPQGAVTIVSAATVEAELGESYLHAAAGSSLDFELADWLNRRESTHDLVLLVADHSTSSWAGRCVRQADRVLMVGRANVPLPVEGVADASEVPVRKDLVILHDPATRYPTGTADLLPGNHFTAHHHVREGSAGDLARLARSLSGRSIGLVLSGGGARGLAHIGVMKALEEAGVPVDTVGGASFGALMAAVRARGDDSYGVAEAMQQFLIGRGSPIDLTAPAAALTGGRRVVSMLQDGFGDLCIEDLWHRFFCVSSNLTLAELEVHTAGPVWSAVRASISIPGLFPPVNSGAGDVLVDGAVMNNLPVDVMQSFNDGGPIIAVSLHGDLSFRSQDLPHHGVLSGWRVYRRRVNPFASTLELPGLIDVLVRTTEMGSVLSSKSMERQADLVFRPPVHDVGLLEFDEHEKLIEAGYRHAAQVLDDG